MALKKRKEQAFLQSKNVGELWSALFLQQNIHEAMLSL